VRLADGSAYTLHAAKASKCTMSMLDTLLTAPWCCAGGAGARAGATVEHTTFARQRGTQGTARRTVA
jgi:hypothetical protein